MVTTEQVRQLRNRTQCPMMDCKKALQDSDGDFNKAHLLLRERLGAIGDAKPSSEQEGFIIIRPFTALDNTVAVFIFSTETDFTAKNNEVLNGAQNAVDQFIQGNPYDGILADLRAKTGENITIVENQIVSADKTGSISEYIHFDNKKAAIVTFDRPIETDYAKQVTMHIVAAVPRPLYISPEDVPENELEQERSLLTKKAEGKPEQIKEKIIQGGLDKCRSAISLTTQSLVSDPQKTVQQLIGDACITSFYYFEVGK